MAMHYPSVAWLRTPLDVSEAADEIRAASSRNPPSNDELCRVIRWMAGPEGRQEKAPSLRELVRAMFILRKRAREDEQGPSEDCGLCAAGWLYVTKPGPEPIRGKTGVPCLCAAGDRLLKVCKEYQKLQPADSKRLRELAELAIGQTKGHSAP
jgi:hypothetical protein